MWGVAVGWRVIVGCGGGVESECGVGWRVSVWGVSVGWRVSVGCGGGVESDCGVGWRVSVGWGGK